MEKRAGLLEKNESARALAFSLFVLTSDLDPLGSLTLRAGIQGLPPLLIGSEMYLLADQTFLSMVFLRNFHQ